jgi:hypothetical protein
MAQSVSHQYLTVEAQIQVQASLCWICGIKSGSWAGFSVHSQKLQKTSISFVMSFFIFDPPSIRPSTHPSIRVAPNGWIVMESDIGGSCENL